MTDYDLYGGKPPHVAESDTSEAAADAIAPIATSLRARVFGRLGEMGEYGCTDDELQVHLDLGSQTQTARRRELVLEGRVVDSCRKRRTRSGRNAIVWVVCEVVSPSAEKKKTLSVQLREAKAEITRLEKKVRKLEVDLHFASRHHAKCTR